MISMSDITAEIEQGLNLLETTTQDIPERQRSVLAIFEGTWRRLNPVEQSLFGKLCIFRGGFTRNAAEEVAGASLRQLASLMSKSLLSFNRRTYRYDIHRLLRQYGLERLADDPTNERTVRDRYSAYYLKTISALEESLYSDQYQSVADDIESDLENLRTALRWAVARRQVEHLGKAIPPLFQYYKWLSYADFLFKDAEMIVEGLVGLDSPEVNLTKARALARQGWLLPNADDLVLLEKSNAILKRIDLAFLDLRRDRAFALLRIGSIILQSHDLTNAKEMLEESLILYGEVGDRWGEAETIRQMAEHALASGNSLEHEHYIEKCSAIRAEIGNPLGLHNSLNDRALTSVFRGNPEDGIIFARQSKDILIELGDPGSIALSSFRMGFSYLFSGRFGEARESFEEALTMYEELGTFQWKLGSAVFRAYTNLHIGDYELGYSQTRRFFDESSKYSIEFYEGIGHYNLACIVLVGEDYKEASARAQLAVACFRNLAPAWQMLTQTAHTTARLMSGDAVVAKQNLMQVLQIGSKMKLLLGLAALFPSAAMMLANRGDSVKAVEYYEMACQHPFVANSQWYTDVVGKRLDEMVAGLSPEVVDAARQRGRQRDPVETAKELLAELEAEETQA